jgi:hypothetical protein
MKTLNQFFPLPEVEFQFAGFNFPRRASLLPRGSRKDRVEKHTKPSSGSYYHSPKPNGEGKVQGSSFYLESDFMPNLRWEWCDKVCNSIRHTGWYTNEHGDGDTIRGIVMRLPNNRGFLAGWSMGKGMASFVDTSYLYDEERDAANGANDLAKYDAEEEKMRAYLEREELDEAA